jgi:ADP-ribose pyrophosphatase YjhB (NUDIX family)
MQREYPLAPVVGVGICLLRNDNGGEVLLARRGKPPAAGSWSLPGGAQELGETVVAAAQRELREETGLLAGELHLAAAVDSIHYDAQGKLRFHYTIIDFAALPAGGALRRGDDVAEVRWVRFDDLADYALWSEALRVIAIARRLLLP